MSHHLLFSVICLEWYVKVKYTKHRKGYIISIGLDPVKHYNTERTIPVAIFYNLDVMDPSLYALLGEDTVGIKDADNGIYVESKQFDEMIEKIKRFYEEFGKLTGETIHVEVINIDDIPKKPIKLRKIDLAKELG